MSLMEALAGSLFFHTDRSTLTQMKEMEPYLSHSCLPWGGVAWAVPQLCELNVCRTALGGHPGNSQPAGQSLALVASITPHFFLIRDVTGKENKAGCQLPVHFLLPKSLTFLSLPKILILQINGARDSCGGMNTKYVFLFHWESSATASSLGWP